MAGYDAILPAWYVMLFSVLFSVGIPAGSAPVPWTHNASCLAPQKSSRWEGSGLGKIHRPIL